MKVVYEDGLAEVVVNRTVVTRGTPVDLPDEVAKKLLEQGWKQVGDGPSAGQKTTIKEGETPSAPSPPKEESD